MLENKKVRTVCLVLVFFLSSRTAQSKVELVDHGYEGIVIAINPYLKQEETILRRLEEYLTATSRVLFHSTRNQVYFREFIVVVPETWQRFPNIETAVDVQLDRAQIIIDQANPAYGDAPYVKQYAECGQPGLYIHLTPSYLTDDDVIHKWGRPEKTLVHEWAHLRWGLFDEYPIDSQDAEFYRYKGTWEPTRCSLEVEGSILNEVTTKGCSFDYFTGKPDTSCRFFPRMKSNQAVASLMFMQYLESIVEFCDDPATTSKQFRHNYLAPNRQNRLCSYKSSWEIMREHSDFRKVTRPLPDDTETQPNFRYVQVQSRKRALVLDTSGSMTGSSLSVMMRAASNYILSCIETGSRLGIVQFSTNATILSPLVQINGESDRQGLIRSLPRQADGKTSIGAGLQKGLKLLEEMGDKDKQSGGTIILITDGKENERPFLSDFKTQLGKKGVVVHSLAYGQRAEQSIAELSKVTGGKTFFYSGRKDSTALIDGLAATIASEGPIQKPAVHFSLLTEAGAVSGDSILTGSFYLDSTVGVDTSVTISYSQRVNVTLSGPDDVIFAQDTHPEQYQFDEFSGVLKISIPGVAKIGKWTYNLTSNESQSNVIISVQSKARNPGNDVIQITSWLGDNNIITFDPAQKLGVFAEVIRGRAPVLNAKVTAIVERPQSLPSNIRLYDNGVGSDVIKGDGVYSAYILASDLMGDGRYNIKIRADSVEGQTEVVVGGRGRSSGALEMTAADGIQMLKTQPLEQFQRVTTAGEFRVIGFPSSLEVIPDLIPPSRITDLHIERFDPENGTAFLRWTAVGGDMDRGNATRYTMHIATSFDILIESGVNDSLWREVNNSGLGSLVHPLPAGSPEQCMVVLEQLSENDTLFISIRAVDSNGNAGDLSNIVTVSRARELAVALNSESGSYGNEFYLKLLLPPVATVVLFLVLILGLVATRRNPVSKNEENLDSGLSASTFSLDLSHMNYRHEGGYRPRHKEDDETWSRDGLEEGHIQEDLDRV